MRPYLKKLGYEYAVKIKKTMAEYEASKSSRNDTNIGLFKIEEREFLAMNQSFMF